MSRKRPLFDDDDDFALPYESREQKNNDDEFNEDSDEDIGTKVVLKKRKIAQIKKNVKADVKKEMDRIIKHVIKEEQKKDETNKIEADPSVVGIKFVVTGVIQELSRTELELAIKNKGASVSSAVSGRTDYLIHGKKLEDGREYTEGNKYKKAKELQDSGGHIKILTEDEFLELFPIFIPKEKPLKSPTTEDINMTSSSLDDQNMENYFDEKNEKFNKKINEGSFPSHKISKIIESTLWAEKYRPQIKSQLAFNQIQYDSLCSWLQNWSPNQQKEKGCLLVGPPGVGKTTSAWAASRQLDFIVEEFNASDCRSATKLKTLHALISGGCILSHGKMISRLLVLMDEADGLSSGDRGGAQQMSKMIQESKVPIICTGNDRQHPKVKTIAKYCRVIEFEKPSRSSATSRVANILKREEVEVPMNQLNDLYESTNGDLRQMLNVIQTRTQGKIISSGINKRIDDKLKDTEAFEEVYSAVKSAFASSKMSFHDRLSVFFLDYMMVPLIMFENWRSAAANSKTPVDFTSVICPLADNFSMADLCNNKIRGSGRWDLLPSQGVLTTVFPTQMITYVFFRTGFAKILGKFSSAMKARRLYAELASATGLTGRSLHLDGYDTLLAKKMCDVLQRDRFEGRDSFEYLFELWDSVGLTKDLFVENLCNIGSWGLAKDKVTAFDTLETRVKTQLTKRYKEYSEVVTQTKSKAKAKAKAKTKGKTKTETKTEIKTEPELESSPIKKDQFSEDEEEEGDVEVDNEESDEMQNALLFQMR